MKLMKRLLIYLIRKMKNNGLLWEYPSLMGGMGKRKKLDHPDFQWETKGLKKVTKFRYFMAGIKLWWLLLKDKLKGIPYENKI